MAKSSSSVNPATMGRYLFGITLLLFVAASLLSNWRVWGVGILAHIPIWLSGLFVVACVLIALAEYRWSRAAKADSDESQEISTARFAIWAVVIAACLGIAFYLLRGRTHFLGDGYPLIHELAKNNPLLKPREYGEAHAHLWLRGLLGGVGQRTAELSYQTMSIFAGVTFAAISALGAGLLFSRLRDRVLFLLALLSGGYALMFFGYAENYSLFCLSILLFTLVGLLIAEGRVNRWLILIPMALMVFFHVVGTVFVPAAIYLLCQGTFIGKRVERLAPRTRNVLIAGILLAGLALFGYLYVHDLYFQFAFVPLTSKQFSIPDYTLLSPDHIGDLINLLFVLLPGLLLTIPLVRLQPMRKLFEAASSRFLLAAALPALLAACVLDPKLGMTRDWDLFSFPGVPLVALVSWSLLTYRSRGRAHLTLAILAVVLGFTSLTSRAVVQAVPEAGIASFKDALTVDHVRARTGMFILGEYFRERGDSTTADALAQARLREYPCEAVVRQANTAFDAGRWEEGSSLTRQALRMDPTYTEVWVLLSKGFLHSGQNDSALFAAQVADGLNPYNGYVQSQLAVANFYLGNRATALRIWRDLVDFDTTQYTAAFNLARAFQVDGNMPEYQRYLTIAQSRSDAPPPVLIEYAKMVLKNGEVSAAAEACRRALHKGIDPLEIEKLTESSPELENLLDSLKKM
jgi:tetratricopeptide (TPR) repeat protein